MNKKFAFAFGLLSLASVASAATAVVWSDEEGAKVTKEPAYFYTFDYGDAGASIDTTNVNGAKVLDFVAPEGKVSAGAGYGFGWQQNASYKDVAVSLSSYKGVCLVYEAQAPLRVDFKQSTITDDNYYGMELPAAASPKKMFIAFANLTQGWKSATTKAWAIASQTGVQFSYKNTHATAAKQEANEVILHSFTLADECVTNAPNIKEGFAGYNGGTLTLNEGDVHEIALSDVFEDADGDDLKITVAVTSANKSVALQETATSFTLNDVLHFAVASNPDGPADVVITATDPTNKSVKFSFSIETVDTENLPVAKNSSYEVNEDAVLKVSLGSPLTKYGSDADGDEIALKLVSSTTHGVLDLDEETGIFSYTPDKDFNGVDEFTYKFVEVADPTRESEVATATIKVINVNDETEVEVLASTFVYDGEEMNFGDTITVDEDFETFTISIPKANFVITDIDGDDDYKISTKNSGVYNSSVTVGAEDYLIEISAKKDSNGVARLSLMVEDPTVSIPTPIAVIKVNPVMDLVTPVADKYNVYQDSINKVDAKKGVLANDLNPDGDTNAITVLDIQAEHGVVTLEKDGSFTYEAESDYVGEDYFSYKVQNADGSLSKMAIVTLNVLYKNRAPQIVEGVQDTVSKRLSALTEDFTSLPSYKKVEMQSWFEDDATAATALKFSVRSEDSLLAPVITSTGVLQVKSVRDACGDASIIVTATDAEGASTDLVLNASIACLNDKPVAVNDTIYIPSEGWSADYDLNKLAYDADGEELIFTVAETATNKASFEWTTKDNILSIATKKDAGLTNGNLFVIVVKVADEAMASAETPTAITTKLTIIVRDEKEAIKPVLAGKVQNWQGAIKANRGMAAIFDMQGRVMWKSALPVSESEVRAAASSIQGRKVLRVNQQTFTIK